MSQENVELLERAYDAFNRQELDEFLTFLDPNVKFEAATGVVEGSFPDGHDGIREWWRDLFSVYPFQSGPAPLRWTKL